MGEASCSQQCAQQQLDRALLRARLHRARQLKAQDEHERAEREAKSLALSSAAFCKALESFALGEEAEDGAACGRRKVATNRATSALRHSGSASSAARVKRGDTKGVTKGAPLPFDDDDDDDEHVSGSSDTCSICYQEMREQAVEREATGHGCGTGQHGGRGSGSGSMAAAKASCGTSQPLRALGCGHTFHCACIHPWLKRSQTCPLCRQPAQIDLRELDQPRLRSALPSRSDVAGAAGAASEGPPARFRGATLSSKGRIEQQQRPRQPHVCPRPSVIFISGQYYCEGCQRWLRYFEDLPRGAGLHEP
jgi:hypothetical protein